MLNLIKAYLDVSQCFHRWSYAEKAIHALHLISGGKGYIKGIIKFKQIIDVANQIIDEAGSGFLGRIHPTDLAFASNFLAYVPYGGEIVCNENMYSCLEILDPGQNYSSIYTSSFKTPAFGVGADLDPRCPAAICDPIDLDVNCSANSDPVCWHSKVKGELAVYFDIGCALDDTNCQNTEQTGAITAVSLLKGGYVHSCKSSSGTIFPAEQVSSQDFKARYNVNGSNGRMLGTFFEKAEDRGTGYTRFQRSLSATLNVVVELLSKMWASSKADQVTFLHFKTHFPFSYEHSEI